MAKNWITRWKPQIICVMGGFLLYGIALRFSAAGSDVAGGYLERGDYGEDEKVYEFLVEGLGEDPVPCRAEIPARKRTEAEAEQAFREILDGLGKQILGENESLDQVRSDLTLPSSIGETGIKADWHSSAPEILDSYGRILAEDCPEQGLEVWLTVELSDGTYQDTGSFPVRVLPEIMTGEERLAEAIAEEIRLAGEKDPAGKAVKLPNIYDGRRLTYRQENGEYRMIPILGILAALLLYAREKRSGAEEEKRRQRQLMLDYADVVYQLMVFVGAGLTIGRAWERIVKNYEDRLRKKGAAPRPAYEAMADAQARMRCGVPESQAIAEFGQNCRLQPYRRLSGMLEQNRRTGTRDLTELLEREMDTAWEQQKNIARRLGEEAGTKLLLPLLLMLLVIMVMIMVPAMLTMM